MDEKYMIKMTISEFSAFSGVPVTTLRYYDTMGVFPPAERGTGAQNGYRYYYPTQIMALRMIQVLTRIGVTLEVVKELAQIRSPGILLKQFTLNKVKVLNAMRLIAEDYAVIDTYSELLIDAISATETEIYVAEMPEKRIILGDANSFDGTADYMLDFIRFYCAPHEPALDTGYPTCGFFDSMDEFLRNPSCPSRFFSLNPNGHDIKKAGLYLIGYTRGDYGQTNGLPERMAAFAAEHGLSFNGPVYNIYLADEISVVNPADYLLQVCASVSDAGRASYRWPQRRIKE